MLYLLFTSYQITSPLDTDKLTSQNGGKFRDVLSLYSSVDVQYLVNKSCRIPKQTNFNWEMFNMFNIIETLPNYFTANDFAGNLRS